MPVTLAKDPAREAAASWATPRRPTNAWVRTRQPRVAMEEAWTGQASEANAAASPRKDRGRSSNSDSGRSASATSSGPT